MNFPTNWPKLLGEMEADRNGWRNSHDRLFQENKRLRSLILNVIAKYDACDDFTMINVTLRKAVKGWTMKDQWDEAAECSEREYHDAENDEAHAEELAEKDAEIVRLRRVLAPLLSHADAHDYAPPIRMSVRQCREIKEKGNG